MNMRNIVAILLISSMISVPAYAQEQQVEALRKSMLDLIKQLTKKGTLTKEAAERLVRQTEVVAKPEVAQSAVAAADVSAQSGVAAAPAVAQSGVAATEASPVAEVVAPEVVRVPYIPDSLKYEMAEIIKHDVLAQARGERWGEPGAMPSWVSRLTWDGDFRLRFQSDRFPAGNATPTDYNPPGLTLIANSTDAHLYTRVQARLGVKAKISDVTYTAFRFSTGSTTNPVSNNQTMGTGYNKYTLLLDRAFVHSDPTYWLALNGGKMPNPWLSTDLVWDGDVSFEGVAVQLKPQFTDSWSGFLTLGAFPYQDIERSNVVLANSKWLYGTQFGLGWAAPNSSNFQLGLALYQFKNVEGTPNATLGSHFYDKTAAQGMQKGNSLMYVNAVGDTTIYGIASKFREVNLTAKMDWALFDPVHVLLAADYVKNIGFKQDEILARTGLDAGTPRVNGHQATLMVGVPRMKRSGDWQASVAYKYLEKDAVLDALTDSDFHLGGTNAKGFIVGGSYGVDDNAWLSLRWISTDQIEGLPLSIDTLQLDLNTRF